MPIRSRSPTPGFTLTHDQLSQIRAWKEEDAKLQQRREELRALLSAAEILGGQQQASEVRLSNGKDHDDGPTDMTKALETIAKSSPQPLTKDEMKNKLRAQRFSEDRLGPYFYTVVARLKKNERIQVLADGRIWGPKDLRRSPRETLESAS